ncbi:MAG TPA: GntR family transcriptional regulator [Terriglobales bacterium]|nr:GntR family transcriptional regulator [Terriglobales bacterium]
MDRSPIHRVSVADQVAGILRQRILDGELRPGTALPEIPLAASLGVSRNTMREAVRILALEGLLQRNIHRGVAVAQLSLKDVQEIYDLRRMVEVQAILGARNRPVELMQQLRAAVDGYERAVRSRDWAQAVNWDFQFHKLVIHLRGNKRLETFYQKVIGELRMGMVLVDRTHNDPGALIPVHRKLYQLLDAGKLKQCADLLLQHLDDSEARLGGIMAGQAEHPSNKKNKGNHRAAEESVSRAAAF